MKITDDQIALLDSIKCRKISRCCTKWLNDIQPLAINGKPNNISTFFKGLVLNGDESYASYVLLSEEEKVLVFFTIRCGELQNDIQDLSALEKKYVDQCIPLFKQLIDNANGDAKPDILELDKIVCEAIDQGIDLNRLYKLIKREVDAKMEPTPGIHHVYRIHPAIELVAYGKTKFADEFKRKHSLPRSLPQTLFWHHILPKIEEVQALVGCKYAYLFAADEKPEGGLVSMYENSLHFNANDGLIANKPHIDFKCWLKYQKITELARWGEDFFEHFNPDADDV